MALAASNYRTLAGVVFAEPLEDQVALLDWVDAHVGWPRQVITWATPAVGCSRRCWPNAIPTGSTGRSRCAGRLVASAPSSTSPWTSPSRSGPCWPQAATWSLCASPTPMPPRRGWTRSSRALYPRPDDVTGQVAEQALYDTIVYTDFWTTLRQDLERRAGGNPSWNTGVDYGRQLDHSSQSRLVRRAYDEAGLDLERLAAAPRIGADDGAVGWLAQFTPTGRIRVPVLALHATGDGAAVPEHERRYAQQVRHAGDQDLLRQLFTERGGHCAFTPSELI